MKIERFEDIQAWQKARLLVLLVYKIFKSNKDYRFRDQIQSASVSIMNNISEGFERRGDKELSRFLFISKGSCGEVRSMSYLALDLKYITENEFTLINDSSIEISRMISGFIKSLNTR
jgi:four helix bundle protein